MFSPIATPVTDRKNGTLETMEEPSSNVHISLGVLYPFLISGGYSKLLRKHELPTCPEFPGFHWFPVDFPVISPYFPLKPPPSDAPRSEACAGSIHPTGRRPQDSSALAGGAGTGGPGVKCAAKV